MPKSLGGLYQIYSFFMTHMSSLRAGITSKSTAESSFSVQTVFKKKKRNWDYNPHFQTDTAGKKR
jgi:hypothetical protein